MPVRDSTIPPGWPTIDVVIPAEHAVLLEIIAAQHGIHESTRKLLREINHRYVGWPQTLEELPQAARDYIRWIEDAVEVRADFVGVGPERDATIERDNPFDRSGR